LGSAHQQTSERAAPPVSEEEKGKATGGGKKAIISAYEHTKLKLTVFMLLGGPQNTIYKKPLGFHRAVLFAPFSVFSSRMSAPYLYFAILFIDYCRIDFAKRTLMNRFTSRLSDTIMALVHNAGKLKFKAEKRGKKRF
jgi:hypothetical protein